jgi:AcrR family transcriptional regulator
MRPYTARTAFNPAADATDTLRALPVSTQARRRATNSPAGPIGHKVQAGTREKLMSAAERLFAERGVESVSIRDIAAAAGVNSALIAYHFGGKEELFVAVYKAIADPINTERRRRFDALEKLSPGPSLEEILEAWMRPALVDYVDAEHARFAKLALVGALYDQRGQGRLGPDVFNEVNDRFVGFLQRALPDVPRATLVWRLYFLIGAVMMAARQRARGMAILSNGQCDPRDTEAMYQELLAFAVAGLRAGTKDEAAGPA